MVLHALRQTDRKQGNLLHCRVFFLWALAFRLYFLSFTTRVQKLGLVLTRDHALWTATVGVGLDRGRQLPIEGGSVSITTYSILRNFMCNMQLGAFWGCLALHHVISCAASSFRSATTGTSSLFSVFLFFSPRTGILAEDMAPDDNTAKIACHVLASTSSPFPSACWREHSGKIC